MERRGFIARIMAAIGLAGVSSISGRSVARSAEFPSRLRSVPRPEKKTRYVGAQIACDEKTVYDVYLSLDGGILERWTLDQGRVFRVQRYTYDRSRALAMERWKSPITAERWTLKDVKKKDKRYGLENLPLEEDPYYDPILPVFTLYPEEARVRPDQGVFAEIRNRCLNPRNPSLTVTVPEDLMPGLVDALWASMEIDRK